ncbi:MAG: PH domain-containing protein [Bacilli bacterium]
MTLDLSNKKFAKQMQLASEHFEVGETCLEGVFGAYETESLGSNTIKSGVFLATNKRLFFYAKRTFGFDSETYLYQNISSLEVSKKFAGYTISFYASNNKVKMKMINFGDVESFVAFVKNRMDSKNTIEPNDQIDVVQKLKDFKELLDLDIISQEEFDKKKQELLN